jgi:NADH-quinone oxidoreductase subunit C
VTQEELHADLSGRFPELEALGGRIPATLVPRERLLEVCRHLREVGVDYPASITAIDYMDYFEIVYQLRAMASGWDATLKVRVWRDDPVVPSVFGVWPGADFQEREIWDLMGVEFDGHPNLTRILLWDEFIGHPLRKDFGIPAPLPPEVDLALREEGVAAANERR